MIKHLSGDYETVEYEEKRCIMLYHNTQYEEYPVHWHQEIEIIMPLHKCYRLEIGDREYVIRENEVFFIPPGELHHLFACEGERLILQCDNSLLGAQPVFDSIMRGLKAPVLIDESYGSELQAVAKKTMLEIFSLYFSGSELAEVRIYSLLVRLLIALRTRQLTEKTPGVEGTALGLVQRAWDLADRLDLLGLKERRSWTAAATRWRNTTKSSVWC